MRQIRDHGQQSRYDHVRIGINGRMDTIQAAILLAKLEVFDEEIKKRQDVANYYREQLTDLEEKQLLELPEVLEDNRSTWAQYTIRVAGRDAIQSQLNQLNIPTSIHYPDLVFNQPAMKNRPERQLVDNYPEARRAAAEVLSLPMHAYLSLDVQSRVTSALRRVLT